MTEVETYTLIEPVTVAKQEYRELRFRTRVKGKDLKGIEMKERMSWDDVIVLSGRLSGSPSIVIEELGFQDLQNIAILVNGFLWGSPETGPTQSPSSGSSSDSVRENS